MSYNIKYDATWDTINNWNDRKATMVELIKKHQPAIFGVQEAMHHQAKYIENSLENYSMIGVARDDGKTKGEYSSLFYDTTKFKILESNTFWLSETPTLPSISWDAAYNRVCTYALFKSTQTEHCFWVFNTHYDHISEKAREKSSSLILNKIENLNTSGFPTLLMGDFNAQKEELPIKKLLAIFKDPLDEQIKLDGIEGTFNGFTNETSTQRIDFILTHKIETLQYKHIADKLLSGKQISDHYPVLITVNL